VGYGEDDASAQCCERVQGPIPDTAQLGKAIQAIRNERRGLTGEGLAEAAVVDKAHVNRAENHGRNFTWETLRKIAKALDVPISAFVLKAEEIAALERSSEPGVDD
jgi:transcriptional regulator with XRE-family HTH domain